MLDMFKLDASVEVEKATDVIGGKRTLESGLYDMQVKLAYLDKSKGGANSVNLVLVGPNKQEIRIVEYVTSGEAKGSKPYYEKDGKKFPLPGYSKMNDFCLRATGSGLSAQEAEKKTLKLYDFDAKAETNQEKVVLTDVIGTKIGVGLVEIKQDKYNDPSIKQTVNEVNKWFEAETHLTTAELEAGKTEAKFATAWKTKWEGKLIDNTTATEATSGAPAAAGGSTAPDLFA